MFSSHTTMRSVSLPGAEKGKYGKKMCFLLLCPANTIIRRLWFLGTSYVLFLKDQSSFKRVSLEALLFKLWVGETSVKFFAEKHVAASNIGQFILYMYLYTMPQNLGMKRSINFNLNCWNHILQSWRKEEVSISRSPW